MQAASGKSIADVRRSMFKDSIDAYIREDVPLARAIIPRDEELDELNALASKQVIERMARDPDRRREGIAPFSLR
jgi:phosphate uptake regulator